MFVRDAKRWLLAEGATPVFTARQRSLAGAYLTAATRRLRLAQDLSSSEAPLMPAVLLSDAIGLLVRATTSVRNPEADSRSLKELDAVTTLAELRAIAGRAATEETREVDEAVASTDPLYFDSLDDLALRRTHDALAQEAEWLRNQVDLRSPTYVAATRLGRVAAFALVLGYLVYAGVTAALAPRNLALHKPVRLSSQEPGTPDPSGLVDGKTGGTYGACTQVAQRPGWAIIDLEREAKLSKIVVYNRGDSNFNDGLPFGIDVSTNGTDFHEVAHRDTPFGDGSFLSKPWSAAVHDRGRFVRIRASWYLALSEVEVF